MKLTILSPTFNEEENIEADYVFSLGTTDWLEDDELDHMFYISRKKDQYELKIFKPC